MSTICNALKTTNLLMLRVFHYSVMRLNCYVFMIPYYEAKQLQSLERQVVRSLVKYGTVNMK